MSDFKYELILTKGEETDRLFYRPEGNALLNARGEDVLHKQNFSHFDAVNVRIVLGKACNMRCTYCLPKNIGHDEQPEPEMTPDELADEIIRVIEGRGLGGLLFFGGEPLLYFDTMKVLHERLKPYCVPSVSGNFFIASNGLALQNPEVVDWLVANRINIGISWDGPASLPNRGVDIMEIPEVRAGVRRLITESWECATLMPVLSRHGPALRGYVDYARKVLDMDVVPVYECSPVIVIDERSEALAVPFEELPARGFENMVTQANAADGPTL